MKDRKQETVTTESISLQTDTLTDLPVAGEQAEATQGGPSHVKAFSGVLSSGL